MARGLQKKPVRELPKGGAVNIPSNIYNFSDYREFLKDRYKQLKEMDPMFSFRFFSKQAGFGSPNYLKLVMDGKRNLSDEAILKFAKGLRLDNHESEFFRFMVAFNQCDASPRKKVYEAKLLYLKELFKVKTLIPELYDYYHEWYHSAIREKIKLGALKNDARTIAEGLVPVISEEEAKSSIELLKKLGFISESNSGILESKEDPKEAESLAAQKIHYEQMAELATQSLYTQGPDTQDFESVTLSLPLEKVGELKAKIKALIDEVTHSQTKSASDVVYQLNVQLFALTRETTLEVNTTTINNVA